MKTTWFGVWSEGKIIQNCYFVTQDIEIAMKESEELINSFLISGPDDYQKLYILAIEIKKRDFEKLLKTVNTWNNDVVEDFFEKARCLLEYNNASVENAYGYDEDECGDDEDSDPFWTNEDFAEVIANSVSADVKNAFLEY